MPRREAAGLVGLLALALALRAFGVQTPAGYVGDEAYHVPAAKHYWPSGQLDDTTWAQPPLSPLLLRASIAVFGDDAWGWRLRGVVLGALTAVALVLLGRALYPDAPRVGWIAGLLLALDPLHVLVSRSTLEELQTVCFFLFAAWLVVRRLRSGSPGLVAAGVLLGCAHASKAYYYAAGLLLLGAVLVDLRRRGGAAAEHVHAVLCLVIVPAAVHVAAYLPWFGRGYGLGELVELQRAAWRALAAKTLETFENGRLLASGGSPASWFTRPALLGFALPASPDRLRAVVFTKNPVAWLAVLPALTFVAFRARARARRERGDLLLLALFASSYLPLLVLGRPVFLYSAIAVLPFGLLAVGRAVDVAWRRARAPAAVFVAVACAASLYLYPLATAIEVPAWAYRAVVEAGSGLIGGGAR